MAKKLAPTDPVDTGMVKARVIYTCGFGSVGDIVELTPEDAAAGEANGDLDLHPEAIAYVEGLETAAAANP